MMELCSICQKEKKLSYLGNNGRFCRSCYVRKRPPKLIDCSQCGKKGVRFGGNGFCKSCYSTNRLKEKCSLCGNIKQVCVRLESLPVCSLCWRKKKGISKELCILCGKMRAVNKRTDDGFSLCSVCNQQQNKEQCSLCNRIATVSTRHNGMPICSSCYQKTDRPKKQCHICDKVKIVAAIQKGLPICAWCLQKQHSDFCSICGEWKPINKKTGIESICGKCYMRTYNAPEKECAGCGNISRVCKWVEKGPLCSKCYCTLPEVSARRFNIRTEYRAHRDLTGNLSTEEWLSIMRSTNWTCFYCRTSVSKSNNRSVDHIIPISKGGRHIRTNMVPCCRICNASKNDRSFVTWVWNKPHILRSMGIDRLGFMLSVLSDMNNCEVD